MFQKNRGIKMKNISLDKTINLILSMYILSLYLFTYREDLFIISNVLSLIFVALVFAQILIHGKIKKNKYLLFHLLFIIVSMFSYFYAIKPQYVIGDVRTLVLIYIVMIAIVNFVDTPEKLYKVVRAFIISGVISSIYILLISDLTRITRFGSELGNVNDIGMIIGISSIFSINEYVRCKKKVHILYLLPMLIVILLTGSRKAIFFVVTATLFIIYGKNNNRLKSKIKFLIWGTIILIVTMYVVIKIPIFYEIIGKRLEGIFALITGKGKVDNSVNTRLQMIEYGFELFKTRPILGYGANNYKVLYGMSYGMERYAHNNFIELIVNVGINGAFIYYLSNYMVLRDLYKYQKKNKNCDLIYPFMAIIITYFLLGISLVYYDSKHYSFLLAIASIIPCVYSLEYRE
jgi:O-antigen ligase